MFVKIICNIVLENFCECFLYRYFVIVEICFCLDCVWIEEVFSC